MEFHVSNRSDLIAPRPLYNALLRFFCKKDPMLSTAMVARPAKAGMKADKPLFIFKEGGGVEKHPKISKIGPWNRSPVRNGLKSFAQMIH